MWILVDKIIAAAKLPTLVTDAGTDDISGGLQFVNGSANGINAFFVDGGKAAQRIISVTRK